MVRHITSPTILKAAGNKPKEIREFIGRVNSSTNEVSIAHMTSTEGWIKPGQTPDFDEYTTVLSGMLKVETKTETFDVQAGQAIFIGKGEWVRYSTPYKGGAQYLAVCLPAFSPDTVHRDDK
jgi:mannose-6-phosphate isomerase-like protein (cupin superfamily)